jgi:transitional endoplasmic reticulum ATPase
MHTYERWIIRRYLGNALKANRFANPPRSDSDFIGWVEGHGRLLRLPALDLQFEKGKRKSDSAKARLVQDWKAWRCQAIAIAGARPPCLSPLQRRLDWLGEACSLNAQQRWTIGLLARLDNVTTVSSLIAAVNDRFDQTISDISELRLCYEGSASVGALFNDRRLVRLGLVDDEESPKLSGVVRRILALKRLGARNVSDLLLGKPAAATLDWRDFKHLGDMREIAGRLVKACGSKGTAEFGVNLLFYGPPGTGKSEFAKTLGAHLGYSVQFAGEANEDSAEPNRRERIAGLMIANAIGGVARKTIIVVDEADDLFIGVDEDDASTRHGSKVFMNRLIERAAAPTIWITNDIHQLGPSVVRRMNLALRFARPSLAVRKAMVERIAHDLRFPLGASGGEIAQMPAPPALIENAIRSAATFNGSADDATLILKSGLRALGGQEKAKAPAPIAFDPLLSAADVDLAALAAQVVRTRSRALSFCLSGPPGSGKSAYARYLAERLDMEILEKRFSDLSSMFLGESEKAIAAAFEEAADLRAFLILDEADSLLRDRREAHFSWEVTQVNEMLTWMERHPQPFACTTNAPDLLDSAAARRFLFKVRFLPMTPDQIAAAYRQMFNAAAPSSVLKLDGLTPGDFAVVARKAGVADERDSTRVAMWLEDEVMAKPDGPRKIGF